MTGATRTLTTPQRRTHVTSARPVALDEVRSVFTRWAPRYDATHAILPFRPAARHALQLRPGDRVLDLACGTGLNFAGLARQVGPDGEVVGVDVTPAMLRLADARIARRGWLHVRTLEADAARLPFPDAHFDGVITTYALSIIPDHQAAIHEARRVLRPGGRFVALEAAIHAPSPGRAGRAARRLARICAVHLERDVPADVAAVFGGVAVHARLGGLFYWVRAVA